ncbi:MAG: exo-alpha-sialidase [Thermodesulfobacteriota bacterium]|nr:exo-alpha-sialidase [Thermodesulfobacteriota bacterium]
MSALPLWEAAYAAAPHYTFGTNVRPHDFAEEQSVYPRGVWVDGNNVYLVFVQEDESTFKDAVWFTKSTNAGKTWTNPLRVDTTGSNHQWRPSVVVDSDGYIHVTWQDLRVADAGWEIWYARSTNSGTSFGNAQLISGHGDIGGDYDHRRPRIDVGNPANRDLGGDDVCIVWTRVGDGIPHKVQFAKSTNRGVSFGALVTIDTVNAVLDDDTEEVCPDIAVDSAGTAHVVWSDLISGHRAVVHGKSANGTSWSTPVKVNSGPGPTDTQVYMEPVIDTDGSNHLYVAWYSKYSGDSVKANIYFSRSTNSGSSWTSQKKVNDTYEDKRDLADCAYPSLRVYDYSSASDAAYDALQPQGVRVFVCWRDTRLAPSDGNGNIYFASSTDYGASWSPNTPVDDMPDEAFYHHSSVGVNGNGQAFVAFAHDLPGEIRQVYVARGHPCRWVRRTNPVLSPGSTGAWDDKDVAHPWVVRDQQTGNSFMWYTGENTTTGTHQIGYARSTDGVNWTKEANNPVISPGPLAPWDTEVFNPVIMHSPGGDDSTSHKYKAWVTGACQAGQWRALYYTSPDGVNWTPGHSGPVLDVGPDLWDAEGVSPCSVIKNGSQYRMWYMGRGGQGANSVGYATSSDGVNWTKYSGNPVFTGVDGRWDINVYYFQVRYAQGMYRMSYSGKGSPYKIGYATSQDGINWTRTKIPGASWSQTDSPWFGPAGNGFDRAHVLSPFIFNNGPDYYMYYYGFEDPALIHGAAKIGLATRTYEQSEWETDSFAFDLPAGSSASAYQTRGIPLVFADDSASAVFGPAIGEYNTKNMRIGRWSPSSGAYNEYPSVGSVDPGWAGWFLFRSGLSYIFNGYKVNGSDFSGVLGLGWDGTTISPGWNQVPNPYNHTVDLNGAIVYNSTSLYYLFAGGNALTQPAFWTYAGSYSQAASLAAGEAGWVKNLSSSDVKIAFPDTTADFPAPSHDAGDKADLEQPPAPPGALDASVGSGGGGGGGGCFIASAGSSSGPVRLAVVSLIFPAGLAALGLGVRRFRR